MLPSSPTAAQREQSRAARSSQRRARSRPAHPSFVCSLVQMSSPPHHDEPAAAAAAAPPHAEEAQAAAAADRSNDHAASDTMDDHAEGRGESREERAKSPGREQPAAAVAGSDGAAPAAPRVGVCFRFRDTGSCPFGDSCKFQHSAGEPNAQRTPTSVEPCYHFSKDGRCKWAARCKVRPATATAAARSPQIFPVLFSYSRCALLACPFSLVAFALAVCSLHTSPLAAVLRVEDTAVVAAAATTAATGAIMLVTVVIPVASTAATIAPRTIDAMREDTRASRVTLVARIDREDAMAVTAATIVIATRAPAPAPIATPVEARLIAMRIATQPRRSRRLPRRRPSPVSSEVSHRKTRCKQQRGTQRWRVEAGSHPRWGSSVACHGRVDECGLGWVG